MKHSDEFDNETLGRVESMDVCLLELRVSGVADAGRADFVQRRR